uniref:propanoyl-CoA C-acyltransferase n=1 Tax=Angiostrongylus cantonensis TaxID=6313 RepID=A0A0K0DJ66_ANGCA
MTVSLQTNSSPMKHWGYVILVSCLKALYCKEIFIRKGRNGVSGKGGTIVDRGDNTYGGKWVINPSGGLISKGHPIGATGVAQVVELSNQLRGKCGKRQVPNCKVALQHNIGLWFIFTNNDLLRIAAGKLRPDQVQLACSIREELKQKSSFQAYMQGRMKMKGNLGKSAKLKFLFDPEMLKAKF